LAGAIGGFIDPFFGFGVNSALISGKIASMTILSKKRGIKEFERFTMNLRRIFILSRVYEFLPLKHIVIPWFFKNSKSIIPVIGKNLRNIPGFTHDECFQILRVDE
jgi:flavin-dependent dehydrogenase